MEDDQDSGHEMSSNGFEKGKESRRMG